MLNDQEKYRLQSFEYSEQVCGGGRGKLWEKRVFLFTLCLPLCLQVFFHPGTTPDYRIVVTSLQLIAIITGLICLSPLQLKISRKFQILILLWLCWGWVCALNSQYPIVSCQRQMEWTVLVLFTGVLAAFFQKYESMLYWAYGFLLAGFILVAMVIIVYWNFLPDPRKYKWYYMIPHFTHIRHFSYYAAAFIILSSVGAVWMTYQRQETLLKWMLPILFSIQTTAFGFLFWSGGRGSVIAVASGLLWLLFQGVERKKRWGFALLTAFSSCTGFVLASFFAVEDGVLGAFNMLERTVGASTLDGLLSGRIYIWETAIKIILPPEGHLIFGYGPDSFRMHPDLLWDIAQPHNVFIQAIIDWGVPGLFLFCLLLLFTYISCWIQAQKLKKNMLDPRRFLILGAQALWIGFFLLGLTDGVFYHALPLTILSVCAAIIIAFYPISEQNI